MDLYTVKLKVMDEITNSTPNLLTPRDIHVKGNWHLKTSEKEFEDFPLVTVRMSGDLEPRFGRTTPTLPIGELFKYKFTLFVFADSMSDTRGIADSIIDHFQMHNKYPEVGIIDVTDFSSKESIYSVSARRYYRTIVEFYVLTEEALT